MSTVYWANDFINDVLVKGISTNGDLVLLGNAWYYDTVTAKKIYYGSQDSSRIISEEAGNYLIKLTGKDVSLTVGADYSRANDYKYNLYAKPEKPESAELIANYGKIDKTMTAITAAGDLSLYLIAQTGAYGTGSSFKRTLNENQDANITIEVAGGNTAGLDVTATGFDVKGALKVFSDLAGTITVSGVSSATGIQAASLTLGNNILADIKVTAKPFGFRRQPVLKPSNPSDLAIFEQRYRNSDPQQAAAYGIKVDGDLTAADGVWQGGSVSATVKGSSYTGSGAELKDIDLAAFAVSAGGSVFINHLQTGTISAGLGANTFNATSAVWPLESGSVIIAPPNTISGDSFTAAALTGSAVRVNSADAGVTVAANIAGNSMTWNDTVSGGAMIDFESNVFSAAAISAADELALGEFGAKVSAGALNNQFVATYNDATVSALASATKITQNASLTVNANRHAAAAVSAGEIVSGAAISGVISAVVNSNAVTEKIYDKTKITIDTSATDPGAIISSSELTRNTAVVVSGNTFDAVGIRADAINSGAESAFAAITSAGAAAAVLVSNANIYNNMLLGSITSGATIADLSKVYGAATVFAPASGGVNVTADIGAALNYNRIGVDVIDSGAAVVSRNVNLNVQMNDNSYGAVGIDTDVLTLGSFGGSVTVAANSNGILWNDQRASSTNIVYSTTVVGSGNTFDAVGIGAKSLIVDSKFTGNVSVSATGNSGIFGFNVKGIDFKNALFRDNLGGSVTVKFTNNDLKNDTAAGTTGGTAVVAGITTSDKEADNPVLMVQGRINTKIDLTVTDNEHFADRPDVFGIRAGVLNADAFSGTIKVTAPFEYDIEDPSEAAQLQLDIIKDVGIGVGQFRTVAGDAFDINGSITVNAIGVVSEKALNLRVSGEITTVDKVYVDSDLASLVGADAISRIIEGHAILGDGQSTVTGSYSTANNVVVELAGTAKIKGVIELGAGVNTITIDSNATVNGSLRATGGNMNLRFDLNGAAKSGAVVSVTTDTLKYYKPATNRTDASLLGNTNITINLNNAVAISGSNKYTLFSYANAIDSDSVWTDVGREISFVYRGQTIKKTLESGSVTVDFNDVQDNPTGTKYKVRATLAYNASTNTVTVTVTEKDDTLDEFGGALSAIFDNASNQAVLSWEAPDHAADKYDSYEIEYSVNNGKTITTTTAVKNNAVVLFGIDEGDTIKWKVRGTKSNGTIVSQWSEWYGGDSGVTVDTLATNVDTAGTVATLAWNNDLSSYDELLVSYSINGGETIETLVDRFATSLDVDVRGTVGDVNIVWNVRGEKITTGDWVDDGTTTIDAESSTATLAWNALTGYTRIDLFYSINGGALQREVLDSSAT